MQDLKDVFVVVVCSPSTHMQDLKDVFVVVVCSPSTHMQDLKDVTRDVHYENYRARFMQEQMMGSKSSQRDRTYVT